MGRQDMFQYVDKMAKGGFTPTSVPDLVKNTKISKKTGGLISRKVKDMFTPTKERLQSSQPETPVDDNQIYYEDAGGHDKKGCVYDTDRATSYFYDRPARHSSAGEASQYTLDLLTRLSQGYASQSRRLSQINEWIETQRRNTQPPRHAVRADSIFQDTIGPTVRVVAAA